MLEGVSSPMVSGETWGYDPPLVGKFKIAVVLSGSPGKQVLPYTFQLDTIHNTHFLQPCREDEIADNGKREQPEADDFHHDPSRQVRNGTSPRPLSYGVWLDFDLVHAQL